MAEISFTSYDDTTLHADVLDRAPAGTDPLIVLAGGAALHPDYLGDLAGLDQSRPLVVLHQRGVGRSAPADPVETGAWWHQARDVDALRAHLGLETVDVLGHSAGTRIATAYAAQYADRLRTLTLVTPPSVHLVDAPDDRDELAAKRMDDPEFAAAIAARNAGPDLSTDETWAVFRKAIAPLGYAAWGPVERAHAPIGEQRVESIKAFFSAEPPDDLADRLREVEAPVLVVAGRQDLTTGLEPVRALARLFKNGRIEEIDGCGHFPWVEQPDAFRAAVVPFLTR
jgi:pimeloyl-ACP methyl ester carboxylesterase